MEKRRERFIVFEPEGVLLSLFLRARSVLLYSPVRNNGSGKCCWLLKRMGHLNLVIFMAITKMILTDGRVLQFSIGNVKMKYSTCPYFIEVCYICRRLEGGEDYIPIVKQSTPVFVQLVKDSIHLSSPYFQP